MTNSGIPKVTYNNLERALSSDQNKEQQDSAASLLRMWGALYGSNREVPGVGSPYWTMTEKPVTAIPANGPLKSMVLGGLLVNPQAAFLLVDGGTLVTVFPSGDPLDSLMVVAQSAGVTNPADLPFVPNPGAGPRWDLVECRPRTTVVNQSRDIFDPGTQTFTATSVPKFTTTDLEFKYTVGTAASPAPAPVVTPGWQPVCCIWVPNTAVSFDGCELFDVRPTVQGLEDPTGANWANMPRMPGDCISSSYEHVGAVEGLPGAYANAVVTQCRASIRGLIQSQFYANDPAYNGPNYTRFGRKGYSANFMLTATNPGKSIVGQPPRFLDGVTAVGMVGDYAMDPGDTWVLDSLYQFGVVFPFGLSRFAKYSNQNAPDGRRWPLAQPGLTAFKKSTVGTVFEPSSGSLPQAYDTVSLGHLFIPLGMFKASAVFAAPYGTTHNITSGYGTPDGWFHLGENVGWNANTIAGASATWNNIATDFLRSLPRRIEVEGFFSVSANAAGNVYNQISMTVTNDIEVATAAATKVNETHLTTLTSYLVNTGAAPQTVPPVKFKLFQLAPEPLKLTNGGAGVTMSAATFVFQAINLKSTQDRVF